VAGRTPFEAYADFRDRLHEALGCITARRLSVPAGSTIKVGPVYSIVLNRGDPVPLRGVAPIALFVGQRFRIGEIGALGRALFDVDTVEYAYQLLTREGRDVLAFHWTPGAAPRGERAFPHLHIGSAMLAATAPVLPDRFNKLHVPTGRIALEDAIRFAIEELGVPGRAGWANVLVRTRPTSDAGSPR
jgi:hypothetical protein